MGKQVELLEDEAEIALDLIQLRVVEVDRLALLVGGHGRFAHVGDRAGVGLLEEGRAAKERALAGAGRSDDADDLAGIDVHADVF